MNTSYRCASRIRMRQWVADSRAHALVANPTSGISVLLANGGGFLKCWYILEEIRLQRIVLLWINRFLRILEIQYIHTYIHTVHTYILYIHICNRERKCKSLPRPYIMKHQLLNHFLLTFIFNFIKQIIGQYNTSAESAMTWIKLAKSITILNDHYRNKHLHILPIF